MLLCLVAACALHAALTLWGYGRKPASATLALPSAGREAPLLLPVEVQPAEPEPGSAPGGGSPEPEAEGAERATPDQPRPEPEPAPRLPRATEDLDLAQLSEQVTPEPSESDEPTASPDLVTQASSTLEVDAALRTSRALVQRRTATATRVAQQDSALGAYQGTGPGARAGPGGRDAGWGRGNGVVQQRFQLGGPSGAFRADVCFIPDTTKSLKQLRQCPTEVTFFTDVLDVSPRSFNEGFPGISTRTEWFAIYYHGAFHVRASDYYTFKLISDDGALLYIDGYLIIDNDGQHPPAVREGTVPLTAGRHELRLHYYQGPRDRIALQLFVTGSSGETRLVGPVI